MASEKASRISLCARLLGRNCGAHLREYLNKNPYVPHDSSVTLFVLPWTSSGLPADPELISNATPDLIKNALLRSDGYIETQQ